MLSKAVMSRLQRVRLRWRTESTWGHTDLTKRGNTVADVNPELEAVVKAFWGKREALQKVQEAKGLTGAQARSGEHMKAIQNYVRALFVEAGLEPSEVY